MFYMGSVSSGFKDQDLKIPSFLRNLVNVASLILVIVSAIVTLFLQAFLEKSLEAFVSVALPIIVLVIFFSLLSLRLLLLEDKIQNVLDSRLPEISYIDDANLLKSEFIKAVEESEEFIMATGGKSALVDYLSKIEERVKKAKISYRRVVTGKTVTQELFDHLSRVINQTNVVIAWNEKEYVPMLLITEKIVIFSLPDPIRGQLETCMKIPNRNIISRVRLYTEEWLMKSTPIRTLKDLEKLTKTK